MASLEILTDEAIIDYTRTGNKNRILTDDRDINLKYRPFRPYKGGVYDVEIFGSPFEDQCICGKIRTVSSEPCPECEARVYTKEEGLRRFARIELPFYYLNSLRYDIFKEFFDDVFSKSIITLKFSKSDLKGTGWVVPGAPKKLSIKVFDTCQFEYNPDQKELTISEFITDVDKCSYEGLIKIMEDYFPNRVTELKTYINRLYLVMPAMMRPFSFTLIGGQRKIGIHKLTTWYSIVLKFCCSKNRNANELNYDKVINSLGTPGEKVKYTALLRAMLNAGRKQATELLNTSKQNLARDLYSVRTKNSARCPIVPSTTAPIDEISIPVHLAYVMCRSGFIKYLINELNFTEDEAIKSTKVEVLNPETQKLFKEYAERQCVVINRPPTLHEYNMIGMKLRVNDSYAMELPIQLCAPLSGDFDGDQLAIHLIPEEIAEDTMKKLSPRYVRLYKKNLEPINVPSHETLN